MSKKEEGKGRVLWQRVGGLGEGRGREDSEKAEALVINQPLGGKRKGG